MTACEEKPGFMFAKIVTWRRRFRRLISEGPVPVRKDVTSSRGTAPRRFDGTLNLRRLASSVRSLGRARRYTSYCSPPSSNAETFSPPTRTRSVSETSATETPRSDAFERATVTPSSGFPKMSEESTSTMPGTLEILFMSASEMVARRVRSGPFTTNMISAFFCPLENAFTYDTSDRSLESAKCGRICLRTRSMTVVCASLRFLASTSFT